MKLFHSLSLVADVPVRVPVSFSATDITSSSATIQWEFNEPYNPNLPESYVVRYGVISGDLQSTSSPAVNSSIDRMTYSTKLTSLLPNTAYHYHVRSGNKYQSESTEEMAFMTESEEVGITEPPSSKYIIFTVPSHTCQQSYFRRDSPFF